MSRLTSSGRHRSIATLQCELWTARLARRRASVYVRVSGWPPSVIQELENGVLPIVGEQKDIRYFAATSRSILNGPVATGMGFWSINPYVGCAFGCQYCYARYAHRYVAERLNASADAVGHDSLPTDNLPPWLAFERRILVKREAPALLRRAPIHTSRPSAAFVSRAACWRRSPNNATSP